MNSIRAMLALLEKNFGTKALKKNTNDTFKNLAIS